MANVLLDEVDRALEQQGHRFVRYADDCNVYVRSQRAGERVMSGLRKCYAKLRLKVNEAKSTVTGAFGRKFLGYSLWRGPRDEVKRTVAIKARAAFKQRVRRMTKRNGGRSMGEVAQELRSYLLGWKASTNGCGIGCAPCSSSIGGTVRRYIVSCGRWGRPRSTPHGSPATRGAGGVTAATS